MAQPRLVIRRQCTHQRPFRTQSHIHAGCLFQFERESRPARLARHDRARPGPLAGLSLRAGREHPRGGVARASTGRPLSNTATDAPRAARRQAIPRPMTPAPMMATVGLLNIACWAFRPRRLPSLWNNPDRFVGFDLSRVAAAPQAVLPMMGFPAPLHKTARRSPDAANVRRFRWIGGRMTQQSRANKAHGHHYRRAQKSSARHRHGQSRSRTIPARQPGRDRRSTSAAKRPLRARSARVR